MLSIAYCRNVPQNRASVQMHAQDALLALRHPRAHAQPELRVDARAMSVWDADAVSMPPAGACDSVRNEQHKSATLAKIARYAEFLFTLYLTGLPGLKSRTVYAPEE